MTTHIALLRAINVGGANCVAMSDLRALAADLGLHSPRTLLQSGNLVFQDQGHTAAVLERQLEKALEERLAVRVDVLVRTAAEWQALIARNPFAADAASDPARVQVMCLKQVQDGSQVEALRSAITGRELVEVRERELYAVYPDGIGRSRLTTALIERTLATRGTARNWNTVLKLAALCLESRG